LVFIGVEFLPNAEKVCFVVDVTIGGDFTIDLWTVTNVHEQFTVNISPYIPLDLSELDLMVTPDCGGGSGSMQVLGEIGQTLTIEFIWPQEGTIFLNSVTDLDEGSYWVAIEDDFCSVFTSFIIPDGSLSHDVTEIIPIRTCVHDSLEVDGFVTGAFYGDISGGSGLYDVSYLTAGGVPIIGPDFGYQSISDAGFYEVLVTDEESGCLHSFEVEVVLSEVDVDISVLSITPLVVNTAIVLQEGAIEVEAEYNGGPAAFGYVWSPTGGANGNTDTYSELTAPGIYTVVATLAGGTCSIELDVELIANQCNIPGDFDSDGYVDTEDILIFLGAFGSPCSGCPQDMNNDGLVNSADLGIFVANYPMTWTAYCGY
jgi:hypothetical protein